MWSIIQHQQLDVFSRKQKLGRPRGRAQRCEEHAILSLIITTTATTRNNNENFRDAKETARTIDNVANKVAKINHFDDNYNDKL